jgi:osmotically-inducible protein OsmY
MKSDFALKKKILVRLELAPESEYAGLQVSVQHGIVTLSGELDSGEKRSAAERTVKRIPGVKGLVDRIEVGHCELNLPTDAEITERVNAAIRWLTTIPSEQIAVHSQNGWVSLRGVVSALHQRRTLEEVVRCLPEVRGVENFLEVQDESPDSHEVSLTA